VTPYYEHHGVVIYCADCREVLPLVEADVLITDPDYGVDMDYGHEPLKPEEADALLLAALEAARIRSGHALTFWSGSWRRIVALERTIAMSTWAIRHFGIWYKPNGAGASGNGLARRFETWFWLDRGVGKKCGEWSRLPDCIAVNRVHRGMEEASAHPSQKPEELLRRFVRFFSMPGDTILDPFMGCGTTLRACKDLGRRAIGIEINEAYCEIAVKRLAQETLW
jgi:DNA modification methylase